MNPDLWKQVDALLGEALEKPGESREAFVREAAAGNEQLRDEVLSLLKAQSEASDFMEHSAMKVAAKQLAFDTNLTTSASLVGKEIGSYKIEKLLGAGGMGEVYLARETKLNRKVALKILPWQFVADGERSNRFEREARALSALNHPNLITIYEVGHDNAINFIAMEFVEGETLQTAKKSSTNLKDKLSVVAQVAEALAAAHQAGIIHRDIKPDNIMIRPDGYVKVLDFGLAKLTEVAPDDAHTQAGVAMGTLAYMSPEQASGEPTDHRTDIWSLGVVLYELVTGRKPFVGNTRQATINAILSSDPNLATDSDANLPEDLDLILNKALDKDRDLRYQTASDLRADIKRLVRSLDSASPSSRTRSASAFRGRRARARNWLWPAVAATVLIVILALVGYWFLRLRRTGTDWSRAAHLQLTQQAGTEFYPNFAPDGKSFVYASNQSGNLDIWVQRVGGKNPRCLTENTPSNDSQPAFSPDGEQIAFRSDRQPAGVYVMGASGENVKRLVDGGYHPAWSPDGSEIAYSTVGKDQPTTRNTIPSSIWVINVQTGAKRQITNIDAIQPSWSPDGKRLAFWYMPPALGRSDVATISVNGGEPVVVTSDASANWNPVWSPDGKFLFFASDRGGNMSFWRVSIDQATGKVLSEPESISTPSKYSRHLNFSRDGKRMIYVETDDRANIMGVQFDQQAEKFVNEPFWITTGDRRVVLPDLSPDGKRFVMRLARRNQEDLAVVDRDGNNWQDLTNDKFFDRYPRWSPDGKKIVFNSDRRGNYDLWMIDADGSNLKQISINSKQTGFPLFSPDGKRLLFRIHPQTAIIDLSKGWAEQTPTFLPPYPEENGYFVGWDWSPDGTKVIGGIGSEGRGVAYYSFATNTYTKVFDEDSEPRWLSDNRRILFVVHGKICILDTYTKKLRELYQRGRETISSVGISKDNTFMYFVARTAESDIWLLDLQ